MKVFHFQLVKDESFLRVFNFQFGIVIWWVATISHHQELEQLFPWSLFIKNQVSEWLTIKRKCYLKVFLRVFNYQLGVCYD